MLPRGPKAYATFAFVVIFIVGGIYIWNSKVSGQVAQPDELAYQRLTSKDERMISDLQDDFIEMAISSKEESLEKFLGDVDRSSIKRCPIFTFAKNISRTNEERIKFWTRA